MAKLKKELEAENARLKEAIGKQAIWIKSISDHYAEVQEQLLAINRSIIEVQKDFVDFFKTIANAKDTK
jgi:hypothetical protein